MHQCECMIGYMSIYVTYMYRCSMLGCMYHSCRFDFKYCSFMFGHMCLCTCVDVYVSLIHVHVCMVKCMVK